MANETPQTPDDDHHRIDELEAQVRELSGLVEILLSKPENQAPTEEPGRRKRRRSLRPAKAPLAGGVR